MPGIASRHAAGTIGYVSSGLPRYLPFFDALDQTIAPHGTELMRATGCNIVGNVNALVDQMKGDWFWLQGDDHVWDADLLLRLLDHDTDLVVPLVTRKDPPFAPVLYRRFDPVAKDYVPFSWAQIEDCRAHGVRLLPVAAAGSAGMLVRRPVLDAVRARWGSPIFRYGLTGPDQISEDLEFTWKATQLGFRVVADLHAFMGHMTSVTLAPFIQPDGRLAISGAILGERFPLATP